MHIQIHLANTDDVGMYLVKKHDIDYIDALSLAWIAECQYISVQQVPTMHTLKNYYE